MIKQPRGICRGCDKLRVLVDADEDYMLCRKCYKETMRN